MTQGLKSNNGSGVNMGDPAGASKSEEEQKRRLFTDLEKIANMPHEGVVMMLQAIITQQYEGANAPLDYRSISVDQIIAQHGGDFHETIKRMLRGLFMLERMTGSKSYDMLPNDVPPIFHKIRSNLIDKEIRPLSEEERIARTIATQTAAYMQAARDARNKFLSILKVSTKEDVKKLGEMLETTYKQIEGQDRRIEQQNKQIEGLREQSVRLIGEEKAKAAKASEEVGRKQALIRDLSDEVKSTKTANEDLAAKVQELEEKLASTKQKLEKETADRETYQTQSVKVQKAYDDKEKELLQEREITKSERGKADKLEKKLNNINMKWGIKAGIGAVILAAGMYFFRPSVQVAPVENVPQEVINYSKDHITVKFGSVLYEMSADRFSEIYQNIQQDQKKSGKQFTPADRKQYFEKKTESTRQIK